MGEFGQVNACWLASSRLDCGLHELAFIKNSDGHFRYNVCRRSALPRKAVVRTLRLLLSLLGLFNTLASILLKGLLNSLLLCLEYTRLGELMREGVKFRDLEFSSKEVVWVWCFDGVVFTLSMRLEPFVGVKCILGCLLGLRKEAIWWGYGWGRERGICGVHFTEKIVNEIGSDFCCSSSCCSSTRTTPPHPQRQRHVATLQPSVTTHGAVSDVFSRSQRLSISSSPSQGEGPAVQGRRSQSKAQCEGEESVCERF